MDRREMLKGAGAVAPLIVAGSAFAAANVVRQEVAKLYDPVAVLEAMRERGLSFGVPCNDGRYWPHLLPIGSSLGDHTHGFGIPADSFPDFPSAVRWLHEQAAAVDAEFAKAFPLPE